LVPIEVLASAVIHTVLADDTAARFALNATDDAPAFTVTVAGIVRAGSLL
jgi:hypothetical protein